MTTENYRDDELADVRALQRLAYDCAEEVARGLELGVTEKEAAARFGDALRARGAEGFFHTPFAWFGDRAGFYGFRAPSWKTPLDNLRFAGQFFPTERRLEAGTTAILDCAPIKAGLCADIGYAFQVGEVPAFRDAMRVLAEIRARILDDVRAGKTMKEVYDRVDALAARHGYECAHKLYPSSVLGHKIGRMPLAWLGGRTLAGFDVRTYLYFAKQITKALWNGTRLSNAPPDAGLWAIEPHLRKDGVGAKWEEILVVTSGQARWLDDDLPHVRAQARAA